MAGSRNRHGRPQGPKVSKPHKDRGVIAPRSKEKLVGITPETIQPQPMSGGRSDANRVRLIRDFYSKLPDQLFTYQEVTKDVAFSFVRERRVDILRKVVPEERTFVIDNVYFYATPLVGPGLVPPGTIEGAVQTFFEIGGIVPVEIESERIQPAAPFVDTRAYFPFLNDRIGSREVTFSIYVKSGQPITAYYINRTLPSIPLRTIGVRIEGWLVDSNALEEILEQQK